MCPLHKLLCYGLLILLSVLLLVGCEKSLDRDDPIVAVVGKSKITRMDFLLSYELTVHPQSNQKGLPAKKAHLDYMIRKKLVALEGIRTGMAREEPLRSRIKWYEDKAVILRLFHHEVKDKVEISEDEVREAFVHLNEKIRVRHLSAQTLEEALHMRDQLSAGVSFGELARASFEDSLLAENGGDLGYITWGEMDEDFERAAFALHGGEVSQPVKTKWGYHIIKLEDRTRNILLTENEFLQRKSSIETIMRRRREGRVSNKYIKRFMLPKNVRIKGNIFAFLLSKGQEILGPGNRMIPLGFPVLRDVEIGKIDLSIQDLAAEVLVEFGGGHWTLGEFVEKVKAMPPAERPRINNRNALKNKIGVMVRDEFLAKEGYRRGLQKSEKVINEVQWQLEELVYNTIRRGVSDTITVSDPEVEVFLNNNINEYRDMDKKQVRRKLLSLKRDEALARFAAGLQERHKVIINEKVLAAIKTTGDIGKGRRVDMIAVDMGN